MKKLNGGFIGSGGNRSKVVTAGSILLVLTIAMYNWIVAPYAGYLHAAQMQQRMSGTSAERAAAMSRRLKVKEASLAKIYADINGLQERFFTPEQAAEFFSNIEVFAGETRCVVNSFAFIQGVQGYDKQDILQEYGLEVKRTTLEVTGDYKSISTFLNKLSGYSPEVLIPGCRIESISKNTSKLKCSLILTVYVLNNREIFKNE